MANLQNSVSNKELSSSIMFKPSHLIGWLGAAAFGMAGSINLFTLGPVLERVGSIGIGLFIIGMLLAIIASPAWLEIVLRYPKKVGGSTVNCFQVFQMRSSLLLTALCFGYWMSWVVQVAFSAIFCAAAITQWASLSQSFFFPIATLVALFFIGCGLIKLTTAARIAIPIAFLVVIFAILSFVLPFVYGKMQFNLVTFSAIKQPFPGWFGYVTAIASGFYLIAWIVPAFEMTTCFMGEMKLAQKNMPVALGIAGLMSILFFILLPAVWLSVLGYDKLISDYTSGTNWLVFEGLFPGFGHTFATSSAFIFIISCMLCSGIGSIVGPSRTLVQLSEYGLFPYHFQQRLDNGAPWMAVSVTGLCAIILIWVGAPAWLMAATNFGYLCCIIMATLGAYLLATEHPTNIQLVPVKVITLAQITNIVFFASIMFGFQQYGAPSMLSGILFVLIGILFLLWRKVMDARQKKQKISLHTMYISLFSLFFISITLDSSGYLWALTELSQTRGDIIAALQDIFVSVILLTLIMGFWLVGSIASAASQISNASLQLTKKTMSDLVQAMKALGTGMLDRAYVDFKRISITVPSRKDELGLMVENFKGLENQIENVVKNVNLTREKLKASRDEIQQINAGLEQRVVERTKELEQAKNQAEQAFTDLKLMELKVIQAEKMSSLGLLTAGIAHELNNAINFIYSSLDPLIENFNDLVTILNKYREITLESDLKTKLQEIDAISSKMDLHYIINETKQLLTPIRDGVERSVVIIKNLKIFARTGEDCIKQMDLHAGIDSTLILLHYLIKKDILVIKNYGNIPQIEVYPGKINQVIMNLLSNAISSIREKIKQSNNEAEGKLIITTKQEDDTVILSIKDNGVGISEENKEKIFEAFFTTKEVGIGTGLGLAIVNQIIQEHGAKIEVKSRLNEGAEFIITIPIHFQKNLLNHSLQK